MSASSEPVWWELRSMFADPPGRAKKGDRRLLFTAALEQFEQLMTAARVAGPQARPLPLFYAVSQATRALAAARGVHSQISRHGLSQLHTGDPAPTDPLHWTLKCDRGNSGAFSRLADALAFPLAAPSCFEIGALWAALPNVHPIPRESWLPGWRPALEFIPEKPNPPVIWAASALRVWSCGGNPLLGPTEMLTKDRYPHLPRGVTPSHSENYRGEWTATFTHPDGYEIGDILPFYGPPGHRSLMPVIEGQTAPMPELMLWWGLLFGLSLFCRYHPITWAHALDRQSATAIPLEAVMTQAIERLPVLIASELQGPVVGARLPAREISAAWFVESAAAVAMHLRSVPKHQMKLSVEPAGPQLTTPELLPPELTAPACDWQTIDDSSRRRITDVMVVYLARDAADARYRGGPYEPAFEPEAPRNQHERWVYDALERLYPGDSRHVQARHHLQLCREAGTIALAHAGQIDMVARAAQAHGYLTGDDFTAAMQGRSIDHGAAGDPSHPTR